MAERLARLALLLCALAPMLLRRIPAGRPEPCEPEGRGTPPAHWIGCAGEPGSARPLRGIELVLLGRPVDLESAPVEDLAVVPGIGPGLAVEVVREREERGPFGTVEALRRVRGIGPVRLEKARPWLVAGGGRN